ncbi:gustatory receptor for sugar taste 64f-like [Contarinia nasturtii]|uniref:gustatory receptor for sugar taste 64f-like n=1 Tax=Contarinia nasturtii TaxID=265458 RepID=UPI0012D45370|nr:gustatory receptor for sugar taste 64f-like [Contarinia nasturtii]
MTDSIILKRFFGTDFAFPFEIFYRNKSMFRPPIPQTPTLDMPQVQKDIRFIGETSWKKKKLYHTTSHTALYPVLFLGQIFAILPVSGISSKSAKNLKFKWFDFRTLHTLLVMGGQAIGIALSVRWIARNKFTMANMDSVFWFTTKFMVAAYFLWLAKNWPSLMGEWERIENTFPAYVGHKRTIKFFHFKIKLYASLITLGLFIEHILCICVGTFRVYICLNTTSVEGYLKQAWPQIYTNIKYDDGVRGILMEILNFYCTFQWIYMDIIIISISICLSTRFNQLNEYLRQYKGMKMPRSFWTNQRKHFSSIVDLIMNVDEKISIMTAFSVLINLYTTLMQLLHSFQLQETVTEATYFWFLLFYTICRTILVSLSAARINDESQKPAQVVRAIPNDTYDSEANRLLEQVVNTKVGLTGMRFFYFTRPLILSVCGTIITYELVLVQFSLITPKTKENLCKAF